MSKPLFIQADPKIRVHGNYNAGAAHINRARSVLYMHLLEDSAYNIQVSKKKYTLAPGVECIATHEYGQTYLDIFTKEYSEILRVSASNPPAYFGEYITTLYPYISGSNGAVIQEFNFGPYHSFCTYDANGNVLKLSSLYFLPAIGVGASWDYLGNYQVGVYGLLVNDPTVNLTNILTPAPLSNLYVIDTNTLGVQTTKALGLGVTTYPGNCVKLENTKLLLQQFVPVAGSLPPPAYYDNYVFDFSNNSLTALPGNGPYTPIGGLINSAGVRAVAYLTQIYTSGSTFFVLSPAGTDQAGIYQVPSSLLVGSNGTVATFTGGFGADNKFVTVIYNNLFMGIISNIPPYIRVLWNGNVYDFTPTSGVFNPSGTSFVTVKPFGLGVLIFTSDFIIYFAQGSFLAYASIAPVVYDSELRNKAMLDFNNTNARGVFNLFNRIQASVGNTAIISNSPASYPTDQQLAYGVRWVPLRPGDWLNYPGIYG